MDSLLIFATFKFWFFNIFMGKTMVNGHPERAFFQKFETFGLGQTNWADFFGGILGIFSQTISTILAM